MSKIIFFALILISVASQLNCISVSKSQNYGKSEDVKAKEFFEQLVLEGYDNQIPPEGNSGPDSPVEVTCSMFILDIPKIVDYKMEYTISMYFRQNWNDTRLQFRDKDFEILRLGSPDRIWTPDLFFVEEREGKHHDIVRSNQFVRIYPSGEVLYSVKVTLTMGCPMEFSKYPHDIQKCSFSIESYGHNANTLDVKWIKPSVNVASSMHIVNYELIELTQGKKYATLSSGTYSRLIVELTLKRKVGFYALRLYVPFIFLVLLACLSFWINPKLTILRLVLLLTLIYIMFDISNNISYNAPSPPYTMALDVWIGICIALVYGSILEFILVKMFMFKEGKAGNGKYKTQPESSSDIEEGKKSSPVKSESMNSSARFVAKSICKSSKWSERIDYVSRGLFPLIFVLFTIIYFAVYCSSGR